MEAKSFRDTLRMSIRRGVVPCAKKVVVYGPEGIGKSTLASRFPEPLFLDVEGSTKALDVSRLDDITEWAALRAIVTDLAADPMGYQTVVIDTADWAERLCLAHICKKNNKNGIEDFGYGKGYTYVKEEFGQLLADCDRLIRKGVNVLFTAHAAMRKFEQPDERGAYDRWELKLSKGVSPMLKEWADMVLFCNYRTFTEKQENGSYKVSGGSRVMYATHNPCWDAKNRFGLPDMVPMGYEPLAPVIGPGTPQSAPKTPEPAPILCTDCGGAVKPWEKWSAESVARQTEERFGRVLCMDCARKARRKSAPEDAQKPESTPEATPETAPEKEEKAQ